MKIGAENKKQLRWMIVLLVLALLVGIYNFVDFGTSSAASPVQVSSTPGTASTKKSSSSSLLADSTLDPRLRTDILAISQNKKYEAGGRNIFRMEELKIPPVDASVRKGPMGPEPPPTPTPTPPPPPIPLKFYGFASKSNEPKRIFLADEGEVFVARQGDIVERKYKIVQINNTNVIIEDVLNSNRQTVQLTAK
ncbi:MAG TPA: hypothetical protein VGP65_05890 [Candidatus Angelobacter sp.]|nr:hypothetical protein [Candidatus Angelobacter sp.]